jgi:hypothetical protein
MVADIGGMAAEAEDEEEAEEGCMEGSGGGPAEKGR